MELLACPFCGSIDVDCTIDDRTGSHITFCKNCSAQADFEVWNIRNSQWISVKESLPELDIRVLLRIDDSTVIGERWYEYDSDNCCDSWRWYVPHDYEVCKNIVTHWQYLPEPPKEI